MGASIPLPLACKANALPFELIPHAYVAGIKCSALHLSPEGEAPLKEHRPSPHGNSTVPEVEKTVDGSPMGEEKRRKSLK